jgi:hypothetical protein
MLEWQLRQPYNNIHKHADFILEKAYPSGPITSFIEKNVLLEKKILTLYGNNIEAIYSKQIGDFANNYDAYVAHHFTLIRCEHLKLMEVWLEKKEMKNDYCYNPKIFYEIHKTLGIV